jgi:hypothetical protein
MRHMLWNAVLVVTRETATSSPLARNQPVECPRVFA